MVFNATFNNISVISWRSFFFFFGGGNRRIRRKPPTCRKSLTNFITYCIEYASPERDSNSQRQGRKTLLAQVVIYSTTIRSIPRLPLDGKYQQHPLACIEHTAWLHTILLVLHVTQNTQIVHQTECKQVFCVVNVMYISGILLTTIDNQSVRSSDINGEKFEDAKG